MKKTIPKLKKELDKWFSLYIRLREATTEGMTQCFTCGKAGHYKTGGMQCGHFQSRRHTSTRWSLQNCQVQCVKCNMFNQGEQFKFGLYLDNKYGEGTAQELEIISKQTMKLTRIEYSLAVTCYKSLVEKLKKEKHIE
mgnify:CR=1 FL=1|tara:strand:- start:92 stop:505 length:414 start_codon:yes stop_codon:yes gene_type:complete